MINVNKNRSGYKHTALGWIPKSWEVIPFHEVADKKIKWSFTGGPFGSNLKASDYTDTGVRIIQLQNIGDGEFLNNYKIYTSEKKADELLSCNIYPGEIIISKMGDPVGRACIIPETEKRFLMASDGIRLVPDREKFDTYFVFCFINYYLFRQSVIKSSTGSTRQRIGLDDLRYLDFVAPPLDEQRNISKLLKFAERERQLLLDKAEALKFQKKGLMQVLFTGKKRIKK